MMKRVQLLGLLVVVGVVATAVVVPSASGGQPTTRIDIEETGVLDPFLSAECGVAVTLGIRGHIIIREFENADGLQQVVTLNVSLTASAGDNTYRFRDVGADLLRVTPDGTAIVMIIGQLPFQFTGVLKVNLTPVR